MVDGGFVVRKNERRRRQRRWSRKKTANRNAFGADAQKPFSILVVYIYSVRLSMTWTRTVWEKFLYRYSRLLCVPFACVCVMQMYRTMFQLEKSDAHLKQHSWLVCSPLHSYINMHGPWCACFTINFKNIHNHTIVAWAYHQT